MAAPDFGEWEAIWLGVEGTAEADGWYPAEWDVKFNELSIFEKKITFGRIDKDSDDIISSYVISDLSGGGQVDLMTGADQSRYRHAIIDARTPGAITLPQYVQEWSPSTGTTYPLGVISNYPYGLQNATIYAWNEDTDAVGNSVAAAGGTTPYGKPTLFNSRIFIPYGTSGYAYVAESAPGTPTWSGVLAGVSEAATSTATTNPKVVDFEVFADRLWALTDTGVLSYSWTGSTGDWNWDQSWNSATERFMKLDTSQTPHRLVTFVDNNGDPCLMIISQSAAYRVDFTQKSYEKTGVQFAPHPDFGRGAAVWHPGEDLHIAVGLDKIAYSAAGVVDPNNGLSRDDGMPFDNLGVITDLEPEMSALYACVTGTSDVTVNYSYSDTIGSLGTGNAQFTDVRGLVCDSTGDVQVCDEDNERVQRFDNLLTYEAQHGTAGTGNDNYASNNGPYDIAVDSADNLFVLDRGNSRVKKLSRTGTYASAFGSAGSGSFTWTLGSTISTLNGTALTSPQGLARDSSNNIYLALSSGSGHSLFKATSAGVYAAQDTFATPYAKFIAVDNASHAFVTKENLARTDTDEIARIDTSLIAVDVDNIALSGTSRGVATDNTYVYVAVGHAIRKVLCSDLTLSTAGGWTDFGSISTSGSTTARLNTPYGLCLSGGYLWVVDSGNNRVMKLNATTGAYVAQFPINAGGRGIAADSSGNLLVCESTTNKITRYSTTGTLVDSFTVTAPYGITVLSDDSAWVSSSTGGNIQKWSLVETGSAANGTFSAPESLDVKRSSGRIYVADTGNHRIQYFTSSGVYEGKWGSTGSGDGQFGSTGPVALAVNQTSGDVYVVDPSNFRVQQFDATGTFLREWGTEGTDTGEFTTPTCIEVHPTTYTVFVGDSGRDDVQEFTATGTYLRKLGSSGTANGEFLSPSGMAINQAGTLIYVADSTNEDVQAFDLSTATTSFLALPSLHYWTGAGWHGAWEHTDSSKALTWAMVTATTHNSDCYRLWWGCTDGKFYSMPLRRTFHNPRSGWQSGYDRFASTGYLITSRFDALMEGFYKKASRMVVTMDNATTTERVRVQYRIDSEDMPWTDFTDKNGDTVYVTTTGRNILEFGVDADDFSWGKQFTWIQFKFSFERGSNPYQTPVMSSAVLNFTKVPQQARTFMFTIPFPKAAWVGRTGVDIRDGLRDLLRAGQFVKLVHQDTTYRGQLAAVAGITSLGENYYGGATVNFIEIPTQN